MGRLGTFTDKDVQSTGVTCSGCTAIDSRLSRQWRICVFILCIYGMQYCSVSLGSLAGWVSATCIRTSWVHPLQREPQLWLACGAPYCHKTCCFIIWPRFVKACYGCFMWILPCKVHDGRRRGCLWASNGFRHHYWGNYVDCIIYIYHH